MWAIHQLREMERSSQPIGSLKDQRALRSMVEAPGSSVHAIYRENRHQERKKRKHHLGSWRYDWTWATRPL